MRYRKAWGEFVVQQLLVACPLVSGDTVQMHAGADYVAPIRDGLESRGILVATA
ncbi:MAG TPA: hypothetical protein VGX23_26455 [Actinocrinis sp.]|nr:hypothetical protein [Actinocrinis sp.]